MTKTYSIHAWCIRPFIAGLDVEAETPQEAIAIARLRHDQLLNAAEECNSHYPWDEFAAYDDSDNELLRLLDDDARLRDAAPALLGACKMVVERWEGGDLAEAARACQSAIAESIGNSRPQPRKPIVIEVHGGVVQDVLNIPPGYEYEIKDYDNIEADEEAASGRPA